MKKAVALVLALALMFSAGCAGKENKTDEENRILEKFIVAGAEYPTMAQYPDENRYFKADGSFDDEGFDLAYAAWVRIKSSGRISRKDIRTVWKIFLLRV